MAQIVSLCAATDRAREVEHRIAEQWSALAECDAIVRPEDAEWGDVHHISVIGGDGFLVCAVRDFAEREIPFLGWNAGTVGFLMNDLPEQDTQLSELLRTVARREVRRELLHRLVVRITDRGGAVHEVAAFNEVVVERLRQQAAHFRLAIDGVLMGELSSDGFILATSQGTTGYAVNVGGPIVDPHLPSLVLCAIGVQRAKPFAQFTFPMVLASDRDVAVEAADPEKRPIRAVVDSVEYNDVLRVEATTSVARHSTKHVELWYAAGERGRARFPARVREKYL